MQRSVCSGPDSMVNVPTGPHPLAHAQVAQASFPKRLHVPTQGLAVELSAITAGGNPAASLTRGAFDISLQVDWHTQCNAAKMA